ncbi:hypothetical protein HPB49_003330 [Dermacentor silvarum]|uniref:Uncharacterized protein n=1 Tax=Dermacentor silvarum TaxID=543639 RepID=A0ACB8CV42_DERSI|nr:hypothetical protein HPB49_003330 [Dermacentor silvarum]
MRARSVAIYSTPPPTFPNNFSTEFDLQLGTDRHRKASVAAVSAITLTTAAFAAMNGEQSPAGSVHLQVPVPLTLSLCDAIEPTNARIADQPPNSAIQPAQVRMDTTTPVQTKNYHGGTDDDGAPPLPSTQSSLQPTAFESTDTHATHGKVVSRFCSNPFDVPQQQPPVWSSRAAEAHKRPWEQQEKRTKIQASSLNTPPQPVSRTRQTVLLRPAERFAMSEIPHEALQDGRFLGLTTIQDGTQTFTFRPFEATPPDHARGIFHGFHVKDDGPTLLAQIACRAHKPVAARLLDSQGRNVLGTFAGPTLPRFITYRLHHKQINTFRPKATPLSLSSVYWKAAPGDTDASWLAQIPNLTPHLCVISGDFNAPHRAQAHPLPSTYGSISHHAGPYLARSETYGYLECPCRRQGQRPFPYAKTTHGPEPRKGPPHLFPILSGTHSELHSEISPQNGHCLTTGKKPDVLFNLWAARKEAQDIYLTSGRTVPDRIRLKR